MKRRACHVMFALATLVVASFALAQAYPNKPIRFILGFPPGASNEPVARLIGGEMEKRLGQKIVYESKPGANGTIAAKYVVNAPSDGYTLFYGSANGIHPLFRRNNAVDAGKEFAPVSLFVTAPYFLVSRTSLSVNSVQELIAYAKANPGRLKYGTPSPTVDLMMQLLKARTGIAAESIPYKGSPQIVIALLAGEVDLTIPIIQPYLTQIRAGKLHVHLVAAARRSLTLPDVPTAAEVGIPNFELANNVGLWAPLGTPRDIIQNLSTQAAIAIRIPSVAERIRNNFIAEPVGSTPEELLRSFDADIKTWTEAVRLSNFQPL